MSEIPGELRYASSHEWVRLEEDGTAVVGISHHAQDALGDLVFVELPEQGETVEVSDEVAVVESVKAASDVYAPLSGEILAVNESLEDSPELVNQDPYGDGWLFRVRVANQTEWDELLTADQYSEQLENEE